MNNEQDAIRTTFFPVFVVFAFGICSLIVGSVIYASCNHVTDATILKLEDIQGSCNVTFRYIDDVGTVYDKWLDMRKACQAFVVSGSVEICYYHFSPEKYGQAMNVTNNYQLAIPFMVTGAVIITFYILCAVVAACTNMLFRRTMVTTHQPHVGVGLGVVPNQQPHSGFQRKDSATEVV